MQADVTMAQNGASVTGSIPLDGVYWSDALQRSVYERSREFHLCGADGSLHTAAEALRRQFNQEAVLTFDYLPGTRRRRTRSSSLRRMSTSTASEMPSRPIRLRATGCGADPSPQTTAP